MLWAYLAFVFLFYWALIWTVVFFYFIVLYVYGPGKIWALQSLLSSMGFIKTLVCLPLVIV
ncbi:hypothetical protein ES332_A01G155400v1 [Gossypium tomentosum]|uniref:Uncharacterized protein n=1 Tax=Gossypium tomentosum TaxID=34277 RepID=A0A5D2RTY3_GOSTO|nr:hypothetical protein ES332_A01G155400v1 [Gossypium tomentosum]